MNLERLPLPLPVFLSVFSRFTGISWITAVVNLDNQVSYNNKCGKKRPYDGVERSVLIVHGVILMLKFLHERHLIFVYIHNPFWVGDKLENNAHKQYAPNKIAQ